MAGPEKTKRTPLQQILSRNALRPVIVICILQDAFIHQSASRRASILMSNTHQVNGL